MEIRILESPKNNPLNFYLSKIFSKMGQLVSPKGRLILKKNTHIWPSGPSSLTSPPHPLGPPLTDLFFSLPD